MTVRSKVKPLRGKPSNEALDGLHRLPNDSIRFGEACVSKQAQRSFDAKEVLEGADACAKYRQNGCSGELRETKRPERDKPWLPEERR